MTKFMKLTTLFLSVICLSNATAFTANTHLQDVSNHWSKPYVERLYKDGYVVGSNGKFNPDHVLMTEDFLIMVLKVIKPEVKSLKAEASQPYYEPFVEEAKKIGLIKAEFDEMPQYIGWSMPRELAVQLIDRALTLKGENITANTALSAKFEDYKIINDINKEAVLRAYELGIVKGFKGNFEPKNYLTRAESAVLVAKLMDKSLRDKLEVFVNPKTYGEVAEFYIKNFEKDLPVRPVVTEKKADGTLNRGDVDFTEKAFSVGGQWYNWWSDQEFEDRMLENIDKPHNVMYTTSFGSYKAGDILRGGGSFLPHNGEILFTEHRTKYNGTAKKLYEFPVKNYNRIAYDLIKYASQMAYVRDEHAYIESAGSLKIALTEYSTMEGSQFILDLYSNPKDQAVKTGDKFSPNLGIRVTEDGLKTYNPVIKQMLIRLYGEKDGLLVLKEITAMVKGRDVNTSGKIYKNVNGIQMYLRDKVGFLPSVELTLK